VTDEELNALFAVSWPDHEHVAFAPVHARSLAYVCAYESGRLVGYVNLAWDGRFHAFLLDTTVHPDHRRRGIGRLLVARAADVARDADVAWIHVDNEPRWDAFYRACGFSPTAAGLLRLRGGGEDPRR